MFADEWKGRAPITRKTGNLTLCCLTPEQRERTCGYWFTLTSYGGTPYTAFRTRAALTRWFENRRLQLPDNMPALGEFAWFRIEGEAVDVMHLDPVTYAEVKGRDTWKLNNGNYCPARVADDGAIHMLNCNVEQARLDHAYARTLEDRGEL